MTKVLGSEKRKSPKSQFPRHLQMNVKHCTWIRLQGLPDTPSQGRTWPWLRTLPRCAYLIFFGFKPSVSLKSGMGFEGCLVVSLV